MNKENDLYNKIDEDNGLKSKKNILTIASLVLLVIQFSGAKVIEANTFILKLHFEHQNGIALLLMLSIVFLLIRYYNYAKPYHNELYSIWSTNLMNDGIINSYNEHANDVSGLLHKKYPKGFDINSYLYQEEADNRTYEVSYECKFLLIRYFRFTWDNEYETIIDKVNIFMELGIIKYLLILKMEFKYQFSRYFTHRENLDILAPYFLGFLSVCSYLFNNEFQSILSTY